MVNLHPTEPVAPPAQRKMAAEQCRMVVGETYTWQGQGHDTYWHRRAHRRGSNSARGTIDADGHVRDSSVRDGVTESRGADRKVRCARGPVRAPTCISRRWPKMNASIEAKRRHYSSSLHDEQKRDTLPCIPEGLLRGGVAGCEPNGCV